MLSKSESELTEIGLWVLTQEIPQTHRQLFIECVAFGSWLTHDGIEENIIAWTESIVSKNNIRFLESVIHFIA